MKKPLTDEDLLERSSIDGRVSFAVAAFAVGAGLVALLDRVGVPERITGFLGPILALAGLSLIGLLLPAVKVSRFYAAGRAVPHTYAGLATVALATGLLIPFLPPQPDSVPLISLLPGFAVGLLVNALINGPLLRKTGAFSVPDLIAGRFPHTGVRLVAIAVVGTAALMIGLAGFQEAIRALAYALGADRAYAAALVALVLVLMIVPGGMAGMVWGATGSAGIFIAALCLPLIAIVLGGDSLPAPVFGDVEGWRRAMERIALWRSSTESAAPGFLTGVAVALGVACLAPLLSPSITTNDAAASRRAGFSATLWGLAVATIVLVTMAVSALLIVDYLTGERPDRLPAFAYAASGGGLLRICGANVMTPEQALEACRQLTGFPGLVLRPEDLEPQGMWLLLGMPESYGYGVAFSGLVASAIVSTSLVLACSGFQAVGTAIGHDGLYRVRHSSALTSRRLAMTRLVILAAIVASAVLLSSKSVDPRQLIGLAILFSAAAIAPLLALALWPRASGTDAAIAMLVGLIVAAAVLALHGARPDIAVLSRAALLAAISGVVSGIAVSFLHSGGLATQGSAFVHGLVHGETDVLNRDRGA